MHEDRGLPALNPCFAALNSASRRPATKDVGAFIHKLFRRGKANAAIIAGNERNFS